MILAVASHKGGVGKSTTAVNVAHGLARRKRRVLLIDGDAQCSAGLSLGIPRDASPHLVDVLFHGTDPREAIHKTACGVDVLPASFALMDADVTLAHRDNRIEAIGQAIAAVRPLYDSIIIDTPPSVGLLVVSAVAAADALIVPVTPQYLAMEGLGEMMRVLDRIREGIGAPARVLGIVLTICDWRTAAAREVADRIRAHFGALVFKTSIRASVRVAEAPSWHRTVYDHHGASAAAEAYDQLTAEIINRMKRSV